MTSAVRCVARRFRASTRSTTTTTTMTTMTTLKVHHHWRRHVATAATVPVPPRSRTTTNRLYQTAAATVPPPSVPGPELDPAFPVVVSRPGARKAQIKNAKPFSDFLTDTFRRQHDYLRISVTERCNLRCLYCMPEEGIPLSPSRDQLTTPEIVLLSGLFVSQGVTKIRLTGGEPTVRRDIVPLMQQIGSLRAHGLRELCLTTNGLSLHRKLDAMVEAGLTGINLSLDTLDPWQFQLMTRRAGFAAVQKSIDKIFELNRLGAGIKFKINCVVMRGLNDREILPFVEMTRDKDVEVRFIEYMPFDGNKWNEGKMFSYGEMLDRIRGQFPDFMRIQGHKNDTSKTWQVPGFLGKVGFITSMTHNFCGTCNRLRITSDGNLKVCLFGNAEVSLRDIVRQVNRGEPIDEEAFERLKQAAVLQLGSEGGGMEGPMVARNSEELLKVINLAVKNKKEKHAGIGELEHMKNRPMILIDHPSNTYRAAAAPPSLRHRRHHHQSPSTTPSGPSLFGTRLFVPEATIFMPTNNQQQQLRLFSTTIRPLNNNNSNPPKQATNSTSTDADAKLTHVSETGSAHMVSITDKTPTHRVATAKCTVRFTNPLTLKLITENAMKKGDVLGVARVAGIMAAKRTADLIPLCHPIAITKVTVELETVLPSDDGENGVVEVTATVACDGKTGVEMEVLMAASTAALTVYDMCKAVDKGMVVDGLRVVLKEGGRSGRWESG
ncbi:hypothetical protein B0H66DRAFT_566315 [Apodospora peruviana]|uniref:Radical SAM core domain-containing protein n=1 Tax=Apodospora peruviana TaxID=516989 RepID=A0AAE0HVR1_9PEZI|nr:hypothetical protein B0H66DRAFT_566315 [Apodospora peruviana]